MDLIHGFLPKPPRPRLATWLMQSILAHPDLQRLRRLLLVTRDPRLYLKSGFTPLEAPETYMEIHDPDVYASAPK